MNKESTINPPFHKKTIKNTRTEEEQVDPKFTYTEQSIIVKKSLTRGFILSLIIYGLYIYQNVIKQHYKRHTPKTFVLLFMALSFSNYLLHTFTPEFYKYVISGIGWGVGSVMFKYIIDI
tara:strand:- start:2919 stop:3278 length:360 start_codon:yes stop_codon:yes gene_type:complete